MNVSSDKIKACQTPKCNLKPGMLKDLVISLELNLKKAVNGWIFGGQQGGDGCANGVGFPSTNCFIILLLSFLGQLGFSMCGGQRRKAGRQKPWVAVVAVVGRCSLI